MAASVNRVILIGFLGRDPEIRTTQAGVKIANMSLATSESWNDRASGERKERTEWHRVVVFNEHLADLAEKYLRKGSRVYLEGALQTRKWTDQSGADRYSTEVTLGPYKSALIILDARREDDDGGSGGDAGGGTGGRSTGYGGGNGGRSTGYGGGRSGETRAGGAGAAQTYTGRSATGQTHYPDGQRGAGQGNGGLGGGDLDDEIPF